MEREKGKMRNQRSKQMFIHCFQLRIKLVNVNGSLNSDAKLMWFDLINN